MQTSLTRALWHESLQDEAARARLRWDADPTEKRRLFPLSGRFKGSTSIGYIPRGAVLRYVRTRLEPHSLPIQVFFKEGAGGATRTLSFYPDEIELIAPYEDA